MVSREEREKQAEAARRFDAALRERLAANSLTPRVASYLAPEGEEAQPRPDETGRGEQE